MSGWKLSNFVDWNIFFACSLKRGKFCFFIDIIFSSMDMFSICENILINFSRKITRSCRRVNQFVPLLELIFDFRFRWNWWCIPRMRFDLRNSHPVLWPVLKHSINEVIPLIWVRFFTVFECFYMLFPELITFPSCHVLVIWIGRLSLMKARPTYHHNVQNYTCCK
jgi:hypothetical protein